MHLRHHRRLHQGDSKKNNADHRLTDRQFETGIGRRRHQGHVLDLQLQLNSAPLPKEAVYKSLLNNTEVALPQDRLARANGNLRHILAMVARAVQPTVVGGILQRERNCALGTYLQRTR